MRRMQTEEEMANVNAKRSWLYQARSTFSEKGRMRQMRNVCIYRVPKPLMFSNSEAYVPSFIPLGPYHQKSTSELTMADQYKLEAVHRTLARLQMDVDTLIAEILKLESEIRDCYEEAIEWDGEKLSWMFAMDGCFILEWLRFASEESQRNNGDWFSLLFRAHNPQPARWNTVHFVIQYDIMKLENQIPLLVLTTLLQLEFGSREHAIAQLAAMLIQSDLFGGHPFHSDLSSQMDNVQSYWLNSCWNLQLHINKNPFHLLDLYRMVVICLLTDWNPESATPTAHDGNGEVNNIGNDNGVCCINILTPLPSSPTPVGRSTPSAETLRQAGIEFKPGKLEFVRSGPGKSTFFLPQIHVDDSTETLLRNLMAYEECQRCSWSPQETVISQYLILIEYLITSAKDVSILRKSEVIVSVLGSDEDIARMFNHVGNHVTLQPTKQIQDVTRKAREHCNNQWKLLANQFKEEYFSKPWSFVSLVAATALLIMTFIQTFIH